MPFCVLVAAAVLGICRATAPVAGAGGEAAYFQWTRADTIGLHWEKFPAGQVTAEYWLQITDPHITCMEVLAYSMYDVNLGPYEQANEFSLMHMPGTTRFFRGTQRNDCKSGECKIYDLAFGWIHFAVTFDPSKGEVAYFLNGEPLDLGWTELELGSEGTGFKKASFGTDFDFGEKTLALARVNDPCTDITEDLTGKAAWYVRPTEYKPECTDGDMARRAEAAGAAAVVVVAPEGGSKSVLLDAQTCLTAGTDALCTGITSIYERKGFKGELGSSDPEQCEVSHKERAEAALDRDATTKWVSYHPEHELSYRFYRSNGGKAVTHYKLMTGDGPRARRPLAWVLEGSADKGATWVTLDEMKGEDPWGVADGQLEAWFAVSNPKVYDSLRFVVKEIVDAASQVKEQGVALMELAELELHSFSESSTVPAVGKATAYVAPTPPAAVGIPVLMVDHQTSMATKATFKRSRAMKKGGDFTTAVLPGGVLSMGQEPDAPWGDFDELQASAIRSANNYEDMRNGLALDGIVDEFRVWEGIRTDEQIKNNFRFGRHSPQIEADASKLNLYWDFDATLKGTKGEDLVKDESSHANHGLLGALPTLKNEMTYSTKRSKQEPTKPRFLPSGSPAFGSETHVPVLPGSTVEIALRAFDNDADDALEVSIIGTPPAQGTLLSSVTNASMEVTEEGGGSWEKWVSYTAPAGAGVGEGVGFEYEVSDKEGNVASAKVRLVDVVISAPENKDWVVDEDSLSYIVLSTASQLNTMYAVEIVETPKKGKLYQANFTQGADNTYESIVKSSSDAAFDCLIEIKQGDKLFDRNGVLLYLPGPNEYGGAGKEYASFTYRYTLDAEFDISTPLYKITKEQLATASASATATVSISVLPVNDAPTCQQSSVSVPASKLNAEATITLSVDDVDQGATDEGANFVDGIDADRIVSITSWPRFGALYQTTDGVERGELIEEKERVPITSAWVSEVLRYSSQFSLCGASCFDWGSTECSYGVSCFETAWMSNRLLGAPDFYPNYGDAKAGWDLSRENSGYEFIEIRFPDPVYVTGFDLYETFKPGAVWRVSVAETYEEDVSVPCGMQPGAAIEPGHCAASYDASNMMRSDCSANTKWATLWQSSCPTSSGLKDEARIFSPPTCPVAFRTNTVRIDLNTYAAPGWNNYDAAKLYGSLEFPPGLVLDSRNRVIFAPATGIHGHDSLKFSATDCLSTSSASAPVSIESAPPTPGDENSPAWAVLPAAKIPRNFPSEGAELEFSLAKVVEDLRSRMGSLEDTTPIKVEVVAPAAVKNIQKNGPITTTVGSSSQSAKISVVPAMNIELWVTASLPNGDITYRLRRSVYRDCEASETDGVCSSNRKELPGMCSLDSNNEFACACSGGSDVAGSACEFTRSGSCSGQGNPTAEGTCRCDPFAASYIDHKLNYNKTEFCSYGGSKCTNGPAYCSNRGCPKLDEGCNCWTHSVLKNGIPFTPRGAKCETEPSEVAPGETLIVPLGILNVILAISALVTAGFVQKHKAGRVMRYSSPRFLLVSCLGIALGALLNISTPMAKTDGLCAFQAIVGDMLFILCFGPIFAKTYRVSKLVTNRSLKFIRISEATLFSLLGMLILVALLIDAIWFASDPPKAHWKATSSFEQYRECRSDNIHMQLGLSVSLFYKFVLVGWGVSLAMQVRNAPSEFNESKDIGLAIYTTAMLGAFILPVIFLVELEPLVTLLLESLLVIASLASLLGAVFGPKIKLVSQWGSDGPAVSKNRATGATNQTNEENRGSSSVSPSSQSSSEDDMNRLQAEVNSLRQQLKDAQRDSGVRPAEQS